MKQRIYDILKGKVLLEEGAEKNWRMLVFLSFLALVMISVSHTAERRVYQLAYKKEELKKHRAEFASLRSQLMRLKMESYVTDQVTKMEIKPPAEPPVKLIVRQ